MHVQRRTPSQGGRAWSVRRYRSAARTPDEAQPLVTDLSLYDIAATPGVACDISHINTGANVRAPALDLPILYIYTYFVFPSDLAEEW